MCSFHLCICIFIKGERKKNKLGDKPANVVRTSGGLGWLRFSYLFQLAALILIIGCLCPVYKDFTAMKRQIQEFQVKQEESERKITALDKDNIKLNSTMRLRDGSLQNQFLPGRFAPKPIFERDGSPRDGSLHL